MIETAEDRDGPDILNLTANAGVFKPAEVSCVAEIWNEYLQKGPEDSGYYFLVHCEAGTTFGYACYGPHPLTEGTFDLYWIAVDRAHRGRGIAHLLLQEVEQGIASLDGRKIIVETSSLEEYAPARNVYATAGYQAEAVIKDFYSPGDNLIIFTKHI